jgi:hypothetical protein
MDCLRLIACGVIVYPLLYLDLIPDPPPYHWTKYSPRIQVQYTALGTLVAGLTQARTIANAQVKSKVNKVTHNHPSHSAFYYITACIQLIHTSLSLARMVPSVGTPPDICRRRTHEASGSSIQNLHSVRVDSSLGRTFIASAGAQGLSRLSLFLQS